MSVHEKLLESIRERQQRSSEFGYGIHTADRYVRTLGEAAGVAGASKLYTEQSHSLDTLIKEAASKLTYSNPEMIVEEKSLLKGKVDLPDGVELPPNTLMVFRHVLTTPRKDRDGDVLRTQGFQVDPKMLLLWQHIATLPIGKLLAVVEHSSKVLRNLSAIVDMNQLAHDAAVMVDNDMGRFSHGFRALAAQELKVGVDEQPGFDITKGEILEESIVSIPSNIDAETEDVLLTLVGKEKLKSSTIKAVAAGIQERRTSTSVAMPTQMTLKMGGAELEVLADAQSGREMIGQAIEGLKSVEKGKALESDTKSEHPMVKAFDVDAELLQPSTIEYDWAARFMGCAVKDIYVTSTCAGGAYRGSFLLAMREIAEQEGFESKDVRNLNRDGTEEPPQHEHIQLNSKRAESFLIEGITFYEAKGFAICVKTVEGWGGQHCIVYVKNEDADKASDYIDKCWQWTDENHQLKGEAFKLSGGFIKRDGTNWQDLFLPKELESSLNRTSRLVNERGASVANRGVILMGPPGTGKTLSGRVLLNQTKSTFIWVSSKDFWRMGAMGGLASAFHLAKELAPAILFIEDVDNWLSDRCIDMVKTEMDGLSRSTGLVTILTTNYPERLPSALIDRPGRFHDVHNVDLPDKSVRERMLRAWLDEIDEKTMLRVIEKTDGYSGAHLFELCHFAKTLQDEDESLDLDSALTKALSKVEEQREMINQQQLAGSSYTPRRDVCSHLEKAFASDDIEDVRKTIAASRALIKSASLNAELTIIEEKAGRALSQRNLNALKDVREDIAEVAGMDDTKRPAKALCERCVKKLDEIIKAASPSDDDDDEKTTSPAQFTAKDALAQLLASDDETLAKAHETLSAVIAADATHRAGAEYRKLVASG